MNKDQLNPFKNKFHSYGSFAIHIKKQVGEMEIGDSIMLDLGDRYGDNRREAVKTCRSILYSMGWKASIKKDVEGNTWLMRIE
jgi:hypothetical protein